MLRLARFAPGHGYSGTSWARPSRRARSPGG